MTDKHPHSSRFTISRRRFVTSAATVAGAAGLAGTLPESLARAATAAPRGFDLSQVKHLVFLMQENRSFDHYFGTFPGARGFSDPTAIRLPNGRSVFQQPDPANPDGFLEPYHMSTITTGAAAVPSLSHDWRDQHASWNQGAMDGWLLAHLAADGDVNGSFTMGYYTQEDIPFHWALAQSFTLADNYHCSVLGPTDPNRAFWEQGGNDPQGTHGGPILETVTPNPLTYESGPETMNKAGISYKFYFNKGWISSSTAWFANFQSTTALPAGLLNSALASGTLFGDGTPGGIGNPASPTAASNPNLAFEEDCANGVLPDVSFIGTGASEHPPAIPAAGAQFIATKLEALAANEDLWNTTVFVLDYDENDGFFDHVVPPTPDPRLFPEEFVHVPSPKGTPGGGLPIGAGFRVPVHRHLALDGRRPDLLRRLRPHLLPAPDRGGRRGRRAVRPRPGHLPQHQPVAAQDVQRLHRIPAPGRAAAGPDQHPVRPRHDRRQPGRPDHGIQAAHAAAARRDPAPAPAGTEVSGTHRREAPPESP